MGDGFNAAILHELEVNMKVGGGQNNMYNELRTKCCKTLKLECILTINKTEKHVSCDEVI
jgi:hypothetical protein